MTTRREVLQVAASHIGYVESRNNAHRDGNVTVFWEQMESLLGLHPDALQGQPWCAAFVNSVLVDCGIRDLLTGPALPFYTPSMEHWARDQGIWKDSIHLQPGDVLLFTEAKAIHTGFLERQVDADTVQTIEGNTSPGNAGSQANGGGVYRRRRARTWVRGGIDMQRFYDTSPEGIDPMLTAQQVADAVLDHPIVRAWDGKTASLASVLSSAQYYAIQGGFAGDVPATAGTAPGTPTHAKLVAQAVEDAAAARAIAEQVSAKLDQILEKLGGGQA